MITIKDFKKGDKVYILEENRGRNTKATISEREITSVGRIYVTIGNGSYSQKYMNKESEFLYEKADYGESRLLFRTHEAAEDYIEKSELALWLGCMSVREAEKYSLEQLRKIKEILNK